MAEATGRMPKQSPDKTPTARIIQLYRILQAEKTPQTKEQLARKLGCSVEAVRRLLHTLEQELGNGMLITKKQERERADTHRLNLASDNPLEGLTEVVDLFALWIDQMEQYLPEETVRQTRNALPHLALALGDGGAVYDGTTQPPRWPMTFRSKGYIDYTAHKQTLKTLRKAIAGGQVCVVDYHATGQDAPRRHRLIPVGLWCSPAPCTCWGMS